MEEMQLRVVSVLILVLRKTKTIYNAKSMDFQLINTGRRM